MLDAVQACGNNPLLFGLVLVGTVTGTTASMLISLLGQVRIFYVMYATGCCGRSSVRSARARAPRTDDDGRPASSSRSWPSVFRAGLLEFVNIGTVSAFVIVCVGVMVLAFHAPVPSVPFASRRAIAVPAIGIVLCVWLTVWGLQPLTWLRFLVWFAVGLAIYALYGYRHSQLRRS